MSRIVVLDTETTGIEPSLGHRIIEIGCVEMINRKLTGSHYHVYVDPQRVVDEGAFAVHGLSNEFLAGRPLFAEVAGEFLDFIKGAELVIHNAPFDVGFINHEFAMLSPSLKRVENYCQITDSLVYARKKHVGQKNSLDILCRRYHVDNSNRVFHGALLDAQLLAEVYLRMTGGQTAMLLNEEEVNTSKENIRVNPQSTQRHQLVVVRATKQELDLHHQQLKNIEKITGKTSLWDEFF